MDELQAVRDPRRVQPLRARLDGRPSRERGPRGALFADTCAKQGITRDSLTVHADRGSSMTSRPVALLLADLGIAKTH